jgi:hypothetical protein
MSHGRYRSQYQLLVPAISRTDQRPTLHWAHPGPPVERKHARQKSSAAISVLARQIDRSSTSAEVKTGADIVPLTHTSP